MHLRAIDPRQLKVLVEGEKACMPRSEMVKVTDVAHTLEWICRRVNAAIGEQSAHASEENKQLLAAFVRQEITEEELATSWKTPQKPVKVKSFKSYAKKFLKSNGYTKQATNTAGNYLSYDDGKMEEWHGLIFTEVVLRCAAICFPVSDKSSCVCCCCNFWIAPSIYRFYSNCSLPVRQIHLAGPGLDLRNWWQTNTSRTNWFSTMTRCGSMRGASQRRC